jgi:hypothetical protein
MSASRCPPARRIAPWLLCAAALGAGLAIAANDRDLRNGLPRFVARMTPTQEVPPIVSPARGSFNAIVDVAARTIRYELRYQSIESAVVQAHLHTAQPGVNGGIMVWLCGTAALPGPPGTPECPAAPAVIEGVLTSDQVVGPAAQGISPGEFDEVLRVMRLGVVYANVHTTQYPAGEIRGQLRPGMTLAPAAPSESTAGGAAARDAADALPSSGPAPQSPEPEVDAPPRRESGDGVLPERDEDLDEARR